MNVDAGKVEDCDVYEIKNLLPDGRWIILGCGTGDVVELIDELTEHDTKERFGDTGSDGEDSTDSDECNVDFGIIH